MVGSLRIVERMASQNKLADVVMDFKVGWIPPHTLVWHDRHRALRRARQSGGALWVLGLPPPRPHSPCQPPPLLPLWHIADG